jgi:hypothetical protein
LKAFDLMNKISNGEGVLNDPQKKGVDTKKLETSVSENKQKLDDLIKAQEKVNTSDLLLAKKNVLAALRKSL